MVGGRVTCRWCSDSHEVLNAGVAEPCMFCLPRDFARYIRPAKRARRQQKVTELQAASMTAGRRLRW